jgi:hypothetical protein
VAVELGSKVEPALAFGAMASFQQLRRRKLL